jgi:hypothetical protein
LKTLVILSLLTTSVISHAESIKECKMGGETLNTKICKGDWVLAQFSNGDKHAGSVSGFSGDGEIKVKLDWDGKKFKVAPNMIIPFVEEMNGKKWSDQVFVNTKSGVYYGTINRIYKDGTVLVAHNEGVRGAIFKFIWTRIDSLEHGKSAEPYYRSALLPLGSGDFRNIHISEESKNLARGVDVNYNSYFFKKSELVPEVRCSSLKICTNDKVIIKRTNEEGVVERVYSNGLLNVISPGDIRSTESLLKFDEVKALNN